MTELSVWESLARERRERSLEELSELLRIPSISALPSHARDVAAAADWTARRLAAAGLEDVRVNQTGGHPVVTGQWLHAGAGPCVLIYGHFDVQPVDPVELWTTPPFEPTVRDGRIYARGASDDKGNMLAPIIAVEMLLRRNRKLPVNVKFMLEGQEEIGSPQLDGFIAANTALLACDTALNADGGQWSESEPLILEGLRGLCSLEIHLRGPSTDVHSGLYGGAIANPLHALAELVGSLHTHEGRVAVPGFYDDVEELDPEARERLRSVPQDEEAFRSGVGVTELHGEPGYGINERLWVRPTLEVNGMWGGFQGEGTKTVLPREARAKITCRLVPRQEPARVLDLLEAHLHSRSPRGVTVSVRRGEALARPFKVPADEPASRAASELLRELYGREPYRVRSGGTVAACELMARHLGVYPVSFGFGLPDEHYHAPDEFFRLASFERSQSAYCMLLTKLAR